MTLALHGILCFWANCDGLLSEAVLKDGPVRATVSTYVPDSYW